MAVSVKINNVTYQAVPSVQIPLATGSGTATFWDTSDADGTASTVLAGSVVYGASGKITGSLSVANVTQDGSSKVLTIS